MLLYEIQLRNDTAANWTTNNPTLLAGELGFETDTGKFKIGTGLVAWTSLPYGTSKAGGYATHGTRASPVAITAVGGITPAGVQRELQFIQGNCGAVTVTATPPVAAGTSVGQELLLVGCNATNTVTISTTTGLSLNGSIVMGSALAGGGPGGCLYLIWDGTSWNEVSRR
jgi:hypothetical protein